MRKTTTKLLLTGFTPLPAWLGISTIASLIAIDYDPIASHVSVMTLQESPAHLLANIAALLAGATLISFGVGVWSLSKRLISGAALCWILFGISMISNGIWPMGGQMHGLYIIGIFNVLAPALTLLDINSNPLRERLHSATMFVSLASVGYLWLLLNGFDPEGYSGLTQRLFATIGYAWPFMFALNIGRLAREEENSSPSR